MRGHLLSKTITLGGMLGAAAAVLVMSPKPAHAVPSYARQTGMACEACHTVFPELTPFGRRFKLNGYTLTTKQQITDIGEKKQSTLSLADMPPLSVMMQAASTWWNRAPADTTKNPPAGNPGVSHAQNGDVQFPQQLSLFYAGKVAPHLGAQFQLTYSQASGTIGIDNSEVRYSDHTGDNKWVWGVSLNNAPGMQDVWNSTPVWGFPYMSAATVGNNSVGGASVFKPQMAGSLNQTTAGLGAYGFYNDSVYFELSGYRSAKPGTQTGNINVLDSANSSSVIDNVAPYWRLAYEKNWDRNSLEVGTSGMALKFANPAGGTGVPVSGAGSLPGSYLDLGLDGQYQYIGDDHIFSLMGQYIWEYQHHNASAVALNGSGGTSYDNQNDNLNQLKLTGTYYYRRKFGGSISFVNASGSHDATQYGGSGSPDARYEIFEADYLPWLNTKLLAQYTMYNRLDSNTNGFNGQPNAKASDNNTIMVGIWTAF